MVWSTSSKPETAGGLVNRCPTDVNTNSTITSTMSSPNEKYLQPMISERLGGCSKSQLTARLGRQVVKVVPTLSEWNVP